MSIQVRRRGWVQIIEVSGDDPFRQPIESLLDAGASLIIVDLTRKHDLDSADLDQLVACREHARKHDAVIRLVVTARQRKLVEAARLPRPFETFPDEDDAMDSFEFRDATVGIP